MFEREKQEIIKYGKLAAQKNLSPSVSGNLSVRSGDKIVITSTGSANAFLTEEDISVIDFDGNLVYGEKKASSEKFVHIEFYKKRPDINAICHFHSPYLTAFAAAGVELDECILPEIVFMFGKLPLAQYALPGSLELAKKTAQCFDSHDVILMQNHGVIAGGADLKTAYLNLELCESYAQTYLLSKILGGAKILTEEQVEEINSLKTQMK